jgi:hypothetical protein
VDGESLAPVGMTNLRWRRILAVVEADGQGQPTGAPTPRSLAVTLSIDY